MLKVCSLKDELYGFSALAQTLSERFIKIDLLITTETELQ
jgi:hypothetical protein